MRVLISMTAFCLMGLSRGGTAGIAIASDIVDVRTIAVSESWPLFVLSGIKTETDSFRDVRLKRIGRLSSELNWQLPTLPQDEQWMTGIVSHDGWTAGLRRAKTVVFLNPSGIAVSSADLDAVATDGASKARGWSSFFAGGLRWWGWQASHMYFVKWEGRRFFCVRNLLGERLIIDPESGRRVTAISEQFTDHLIATEVRFSLMTLASWQIERVKWSQRGGTMSLHMAIIMAGQENVQSAVPLLRDIEEDKEVSSCVGVGNSALLGLPEDPVSSVSIVFRKLRRLSAWSLRQLCKRPRGYPGMSFILRRSENGTTNSQDIPASDTPQERTSSAWQCPRLGMSASHVLKHSGIPDVVTGDGMGWIYDMDNPSSQVAVHFVPQKGRDGQTVFLVGRLEEAEEGILSEVDRLLDILQQ